MAQQTDKGPLATVRLLVPGNTKLRITGIGALRALKLARWVLKGLVMVLLG